MAQESARQSCVTAISYGPDEIEIFEDAAVPQVVALRGTRPVLWVHIEGIKDTVLIRELGEAFSLHGLALEDAVTHHQHVKVEEYANHLFLVSRMAPAGATMERGN